MSSHHLQSSSELLHITDRDNVLSDMCDNVLKRYTTIRGDIAPEQHLCDKDINHDSTFSLVRVHYHSKDKDFEMTWCPQKTPQDAHHIFRATLLVSGADRFQ